MQVNIQVNEVKIGGITWYKKVDVTTLFIKIAHLSNKLAKIHSDIKNVKGHGHKYLILSEWCGLQEVGLRQRSSGQTCTSWWIYSNKCHENRKIAKGIIWTPPVWTSLMSSNWMLQNSIRRYWSPVQSSRQWWCHQRRTVQHHWTYGT